MAGGGGGIALHNGSTKTAAVPKQPKEIFSSAPGISFFVKVTVAPYGRGGIAGGRKGVTKEGGGGAGTEGQWVPDHHVLPTSGVQHVLHKVMALGGGGG